ncbi:MAG: Protein of unknown function, rane YfhO [Frankiales bacterium]|nr:Protein of unknown function, rane YfhO [Frankiales bacterium]
MTSPDTPLVARRSRWLLLGTFVALLLVYVPLLGPSLVGARTFVETGLVLRFEPWSTEAPLKDQQHVTIAHDTLDFYLPKMSVFADHLKHGDLATWEPYAAGGGPLGTVPEAATLSPLSLPYWVLPLEYAPGFVRLLEVLVAVGFMYLFLRRLKLPPGPALLGGMLYSTSAFVVLWNNWPQAQVAALIPSLFWAVERLLQLRTVKAVVPLALSVGALLLASFPAVMVYACYLVGPYVLVRTVRWRVPSRELLRSWLLPAGGVLLGLSLAAIQLLPFAQHLQTLDLAYRAQSPKAHPPTQSLLTVLSPYAFGTETDLTYFGYKNTVETIAFFGVVGVVLCLLGLALRVRGPVAERVTLYFLSAVVVLVLVGWVSEDALRLAQQLPFVGSSFIGRIRVVLGFSLAVLAAIGVDKLLRLPEARRPVRWWALVPLFGVLLFGLQVCRSAWHTAQVMGRTSVMVDNSVLPLAVGAVLVVVLVVALRRGRLGLVAVGLLPLLLAVEAFVFIAPRWPSEPPKQFYPRTEVHDFLARNLGSERFGSTRGVMFPSTATYYRLRAVNGHTFTSPTWHDMVERISPEMRQGPTLTLLGDDERTARSPLLDRLADKYFVTSLNHPVYGARVGGPVATGSVTVSGGTEVRARLAAGPRRALVVGLAAPLTGSAQASLTATFTDARGTVVGTVVRRGLAAGQAGALAVPFAGESGPLSTATGVRIRFDGVSAKVATVADGTAALGEVRPQADGLRLVLAAEAVVYQRLTALPRIRFATRAAYEPDPARGLDALATGKVAPDQVLLEDKPAVADLGGTGRVVLREDSGERLRVTTTSTAGGWLVVADAMQHGWVAQVDGRAVALRHADHAGVAVQVPAGTHEVVLHYTAPGFGPGRLLTIATALLLVLLSVADRVPRPGRRYAHRGLDAPVVAPQRRESVVDDRQ